MPRFIKRYSAYTLAILLLAGCGPSLQAAVQCRLDALDQLPEDPQQITVVEAVKLGKSLAVCKAQADAGAR